MLQRSHDTGSLGTRSLDPAHRDRMLAFWAVLFVIGAGSAAHAVTQNSTWTGTGTGQNWSDNDNWSPVLSIPPINELIANLEFNVTIPSPACSGTVDFDNSPPIPNPAYILNLTLASGCELDIEASTHLIICNNSNPPFCDGGPSTFIQSGVLNAIGGNFTADFHSLQATTARILASSASTVQIGAQTNPLLTLNTSGVGINLDIISADGAGTSLALDGIGAISAGFNDVNTAERSHQVISSNGATLSLSQLLTTAPPARGEDILYLTADGGNLLMPQLNSITAPGGQTRVSVTNATVDLPRLETIDDAQFLLGTNGVVNLVHALGFGPASMSTEGVNVNVSIIDAPLAGAMFNGPGLESLDTSWDDQNTATRFQIVNASNTGTVNLSGLLSVLPPARGEDWLMFDCLGGTMNLGALETVSATGGKTQFHVENCTVQLPSLQESGDLAVLVGANGLLDMSGPTDLSFDSKGLGVNVDIVDVAGTGATFNGPAYTSIDAGWDDVNTASRYQQIIVSNGGLADLPSVQTVTVPDRSEDALYLSCNTGGELLLDSLRSILGGGQLFFDQDACTGTVGDVEWTQNTTFDLTGGTDFTIFEDLNPQGTTTVTVDQSTLSVVHDLLFLSGTPSLAGTQASLFLGRMFQHSRQNVTQVGLGDSTVTMDGAGGWPFQALEAGGLDVSTICGALADDNFGFGQLKVGESGSPTTVRLYNIHNNGHQGGFGGANEALYLFGGGTGDRCARPSDGLVIAAGSTLELNCVKAYAWDASANQFVLLNSLFSSCSDPSTIVNGAFGPGTIRMVPEPGMLGSLLAGIAMVGALRRRSERSGMSVTTRP